MRRSHVFAGVAAASALAFGSVGVSQSSDGLVVEGLRGQLPRGAAQRIISPHTDEFIRCVTDRSSANDMLSGRVVLQLVVATDGRVRVSRLATSTIGDFEAERCITRIGASLHFPQPTGGDADVTETLQFPLDPLVRPPTDWPDARARQAQAPALDRIAARCNVVGGRVRVTAYVSPGGRVLTAGAYGTAAAADAAIPCVVRAVDDLTFPDPGSYAAKFGIDVGSAR